MVDRWACRDCGFVAWGPGRPALAERIQSHVVGHHREAIERDDFRLAWECPYCDRAEHTHDEAAGRRGFAEHLYSHVESLVEEGTHVAEAIGGSGDVLVVSPLESTGADNARIHFVSACDVAIVVTTNPAARLRLLAERLEELPAWTVVLTTEESSLADIEEPDLSSLPVEVVALDGSLGLSGLGETLSRVVDEHESADARLTVEFDILSELLSEFSLQQVFKFLHVLSARLADADALAHYYLDPDAESESTMNMLRELFDLAIEPSETVFTTVT